ncbi:MAG TPA: ATP-binding protein [Gemmatimonadaceae bacterium]|nr:ATP-binding protein [Gemmatimonadaceae bacterium]
MSEVDIAIDTLVERFARHRLLSKVPRRELEWLAARARLLTLERGDFVVRKGDIPDDVHGLIVLLSGHFGMYVDRGSGPRKMMEWGGGDLSGILPFSRMTRALGDGIAEERCEIAVLPRTLFPEMIRECPELTAVCVHALLDRARGFTASDLHDEKMLSLGKLAAGLAHELNNPATAVARSAQVLVASQREADLAADALMAAHLADVQQEAVRRLYDACLTMPARAGTPLDRADREDALAGWLEARGVDLGLSPPLAESPISLEALDELARVLPSEALAPALRLIAARCTARNLTAEIEQAATRVYDLVAAVKGFTQMDRAQVPDLLRIADGLRDTVAVVAGRARQKGIAVTVEVEPDLPEVRASAAELNQVWANLLDNALDAAPRGGHVEVSARREHGALVVRVIDDGPGIPDEIKGRIFDPFFTTKPIGHGVGMGLETARRILRLMHGEIDVSSRPGRTEFRVSLPIAERLPSAPAPTAATE